METSSDLVQFVDCRNLEAMTKLSQTPPLRVIYKSEINQILTRVNEPLLPKREDRKVRQELKLLQLLGQLELLLEKMHRLELWKLKGGLSSMDSTLENLNKRASGIRIEIKNQESEVLLRKLKNEEPLYPKARRFVLADEPHLLLSETPTTGEQYHLDHLQQLYATACRLYHDLRLSNHKYIVYQLALLYQCINRQGVPFITYKGRIEQRFSEMVASSKKADAVTLDKEQITWLQSLTLDVIMQVTDCASVAKCSELFNHISQITTTSIPP